MTWSGDRHSFLFNRQSKQSAKGGTFKIRHHGEIIFQGNRKATMNQWLRLQTRHPDEYYKLEFEGLYESVMRDSHRASGVVQ